MSHYRNEKKHYITPKITVINVEMEGCIAGPVCIIPDNIPKGKNLSEKLKVTT